VTGIPGGPGSVVPRAKQPSTVGLPAAPAKPLPVIDELLAATAREHGLTLVTRDVDALTGGGARLLKPWRR
jgi:predicted nucleic acid-binding protein